jgi:hypothetical protein
MAGRTHLMPSEHERQDDKLQEGCFEQFMHCTGTLELNGEQYDILRSTAQLLHPAGLEHFDELPDEEAARESLLQLWIGTIYGRRRQ